MSTVRSTPAGFLFVQGTKVPSRYIDAIDESLLSLNDDQKAVLREMHERVETFVQGIHEFAIDSPWRKNLMRGGWGSPAVLFIPIVAKWPLPGEEGGNHANLFVKQWMEETGFFFLQDSEVRDYLLEANLVLDSQLQELENGTTRDVWWIGSPNVELDIVERYMKSGRILTTKVMMEFILLWFLQSWTAGEISMPTTEDP